ncbi:MAG TPA: hypothetical protein VKB34_20315, partial [Povalibacter sp.]|nr:hypothetical protein [Povalibacter sp.]
MPQPSYRAPGVYVEEVPSAIKPIAGVSTSTAAFIGIVPDNVNQVARNPGFNPGDTASHASKVVSTAMPTPAKKVVLITNWSQFKLAFGDLLGNETADALPGTPTPDMNHRQLAHAVYGFFNNGG